MRSSTSRLAVVLGLVLVLSGCGETSAHKRRDRILDEWANREGPLWASYDRGWRLGWFQGCEAVALKHRTERPNIPPGLSEPCLLPSPGADSDEADLENSSPPTYPPDDPEEAGRKVGAVAGCSSTARDVSIRNAFGFCLEQEIKPPLPMARRDRQIVLGS
jgi:hypothetical protein